MRSLGKIVGTMANPTAAMLVIGDEILSGRTKDINVGYLAGRLTEAAIDLSEVRIVPDVHQHIVAAVNALSSSWDHVFTSGGIGPTHDDITADAIADAFGVAIDVRKDARALLEKMYKRTGAELNQSRLRMARVPDGAQLIENPVSIAPGFILGNVYVMAGVPTVFQAMVNSVVPTLTGGQPLLSRTLRLTLPEGDIAAPLGELADRFPAISIGSYPFIQRGRFGSNIVFRSANAELLEAAVQVLSDTFPEAVEI